MKLEFTPEMFICRCPRDSFGIQEEHGKFCESKIAAESANEYLTTMLAEAPVVYNVHPEQMIMCGGIWSGEECPSATHCARLVKIEELPK
jgi:hypothetical protein